MIATSCANDDQTRHSSGTISSCGTRMTTPQTVVLSTPAAQRNSLFPAPALCLRVGVTANRWRQPDEPRGFRIDPAHRDTLQRTVRNVLANIQAAVTRVYDADAKGEYYARTTPVITLISPLAEGGDRIVATVARSMEAPWPIDVIVPCDISSRPDRDPHIALAPLWNDARSRLILDGEPDDDDSLIEANRRMLWNCDLLIAIWDNKEGRGEAGTANVVQIAGELGLPVVQIDAEPDAVTPSRHNYRVLQPAGNTHRTEGAITDIDAAIELLLGPPEGTEHEVHEALRSTAEYEASIESRKHSAAKDEQSPENRKRAQARKRVWKYLNDFRHEQPPSWFVAHATGAMWGAAMTLLTAFGHRVQSISWKIRRNINAGYGPPWEHALFPVLALSDLLRSVVTPVYRRADYFASAYATRHRGTTVWLVILAPVAVLFAWAGLSLANGAEPESSRDVPITLITGILELVSLIAILYIYFRAQRKRFHERWLDYRLLAERLRHLGFLWPLARGSLVMRVPMQSTPEDPHTAWVNWWYRAVARQLPVPNINFTAQYLRWYLEFLREQVVKDQQKYLDGTYHTAEVAEGRVRAIAWIVFSVALVAATSHVIMHLLHYEPSSTLSIAISFVAIVFPGFGAAAHAFGSNLGLPEQALRSASTLRALGVVREGLRDVDTAQPLASIMLGDLAQQTANALGDDLFGWRVDYLVRPTPQPG